MYNNNKELLNAISFFVLITD